MSEPQEVIEAVQDFWDAISGIKDAPDKVPETVNVFPFAVTYERTGNLALRSAGWGQDFTEIVSELHVSRSLLGPAIKSAYGYKQTFLKKFITDPTLGGTVDTVVDGVSYEFGRLEWGGTQTIGYRFSFRVKLALTV